MKCRKQRSAIFNVILENTAQSKMLCSLEKLLSNENQRYFQANKENNSMLPPIEGK